MGSWIAGVISAVVGGIAGMASSIFGDKQAREQLGSERAYIEEMYEINKARAEEEFEAAKEQAKRNAAQSEIQADLADKSLDISEQSLSNDFNAAVDNIYLGQEADTYTWNDAAMQSGKSTGASYASIAGSGVRAGSSLSDAVLMESAVNENQMQFSQDAKRRSDNNNLGSVLNSLAGNRFGIQQNRIGADILRSDAAYLRNSYLEGGHNYNLYQNQLESLKTSANYNVSNVNYQIEQHSGWNSFWNAFIKLNTGGAQGFSTGYNIGKAFQEGSGYKGPDYNTQTGGK